MTSTSERDLRASLAALVVDEPAEPDWAAVALTRVARQRRRRFVAQVVGVVAILAVAVTVPLTVRASHSGTAAGVSATTTVDPTLLVGDWTVQAPAEETGAILRLGDDLSLWRKCGVLLGDWGANEKGSFVAQTGHGYGGCGKQTFEETPSWLARATSFRSTSNGYELLDVHGVSLARLTPGRVPTAIPSFSADASAPHLDAPLRDSLSPPAALPAGVSPASMADVAGQWQPVGYTPPQAYAKVVANAPYLRLLADGQWAASDGCVADYGTWVSGPGDGRLIAFGGSVGGACTTRTTPTWEQFVGAARLGLRGSELVIVDARGHQLATFDRVADPTDAVPLAVRQRLLGFAKAVAKGDGGTATDVVAVRTTSEAEDEYLTDSTSPARFSRDVWLVQFYGDFTCSGCSVPYGAKIPTGTVEQFADTVDDYQPAMSGLTRSVRPLSGLGTVIPLG